MTRLAELDEASRLVLSTVQGFGPLSRADVVRRSGLSSGTLTRLAKPLVEKGFLVELAPQTGIEAGRPAVPLDVVDSAAHSLGIKIVSGELHAVVTGLKGNLLWEQHLEGVQTNTLQSAGSEIISLIQELDDTFGLDCVGISLPAAVDERGQIRAADLLGWSGGNLAEVVAEETRLPCRSANDVDALAVAEHWFGVGRGIDNFAVVTIGEGVGVGAVVGGQVLTGHQGLTGMLGACWLPSGEQFHSKLNDAAIARRVGKLLGRQVSYAEAVAATAPEADAELAETAAALGHLVAVTMLAYGPSRVLLTGEGIALVDGRLAQVKSALAEHKFFDADLPELVVKQQHFFDWARGGAILAMRDLLAARDPQLISSQ